jgi:hypothetical protein
VDVTKATHRKAAAARLALAENLMLAPAVMTMRLPIMAAEAAASALGAKSESAGAVAEKWRAMGDGFVAAQFAWIQGAMLFPLSLAKATSLHGPIIDMAGDIAVAALQPAAIQVRRNHRRLSRRDRKS